MWLDKPSKTLSAAVAALFFGAVIVTLGLSSLNWLLG